MQVKIKNAEAYLNESGMDWTITCSDSVGRQYYLKDATMSRFMARALAAKVDAKGEINMDLWICHVPYGSVAWELEGHEQRQIEDERFGYC